MIKLYNTNVDVLVVRKSDYQNNNIGDGYFLVPIEEWTCEDDGLKSFHLFLTKFYGNKVSLFLTSEGNPVISENYHYYEEVIILRYKYY